MKLRMLKILFYTGFLIPLLCLSACQSPNNSTKDKLKIFKYNEHSGITSTDPILAKAQSNIWCVNHLYNGLVQLNHRLEIEPSLAKYWTISSDGLLYTFYLRNDVQFIEDKCFKVKNRKLKASDVVYSFNRLLDPAFASPGAWIFRGKVIDKNPFVAVNDTVFQLRLISPFPPILSMLSMQYTYIVPQEAVSYYGRQFSYHPVGTGPFKLKAWEEGSAMYLVKNEHYFEKENGKALPYLDGIKISFIANKKSEFMEFTAGKLSFVSDLETSYIDQVLDDNGQLLAQYKGKYQLMKCPYLKTEYIGFNMKDTSSANPLHDKLVRKALNYCVDREKIITYFRNLIGYPATGGMIPIGLPCFDSTKVKGYSYDLEKAKQLLIQAHYYELQRPHSIVLYTNENYKEIALTIAKEADKIGLYVQVEIIEPNILREWMTQGKAPCFRASWIADYPEGESFLCLFYSKNAAPPNYTQFHNAAFDKLYEQSLLENNLTKRYELYHEMERIYLDESPVMPIYYEEVLRFVQNNIIGLEPNAMNLLDLKRVQIK